MRGAQAVNSGVLTQEDSLSTANLVSTDRIQVYHLISFSEGDSMNIFLSASGAIEGYDGLMQLGQLHSQRQTANAVREQGQAQRATNELLKQQSQLQAESNALLK